MDKNKKFNADDFMDATSHIGFALDKIEELESSVDLTEEEGNKIEQARTMIDEAKSMLSELFPIIKSLDSETRQQLKNEFY